MRPRREQPIITLIMRELETGPSTAYELAHVTGIHVRNLREYLKLLHAEKKIHITSYEALRTGPAVPVWAIRIGNSRDARRHVYKPRRSSQDQKTLRG